MKNLDEKPKGLRSADQIIFEYTIKDSTVDSGNLFFAVLEYRKEYEKS